MFTSGTLFLPESVANPGSCSSVISICYKQKNVCSVCYFLSSTCRAMFARNAHNAIVSPGIVKNAKNDTNPYSPPYPTHEPRS